MGAGQTGSHPGGRRLVFILVAYSAAFLALACQERGAADFESGKRVPGSLENGWLAYERGGTGGRGRSPC